MTRTFHASLGVALSLAGALALGGPARAQAGRQQDKNNMRNLGIVLGAAAVHQAIKGKPTNALALGAGAAYSAKKYEDARKAQSQENSWRFGRYDDRGDYRYDERDYRDGAYRYDDRRDGDCDREPAGGYRNDNGRKLGHYKNVTVKKSKYRR